MAPADHGLPDRRSDAAVPAQHGRPTDPWTGYSADLRSPANSRFRASDNDRSRAADVVGEAYAEGRIRHDEYDERLDHVMNAGTLGELAELIRDIALPMSHSRSVAPRPAAGPATRGSFWSGPVTKITFGAWLVVAAILNAIWIMVGLGNGELGYYWPMWGMFGSAIPTFLVAWITHLAGVNPRPPRPQNPRDQIEGTRHPDDPTRL